jgi:hypothetical protein
LYFFFSSLFSIFIILGDNNSGRPHRENVTVCSQKRALCVTAAVLGALMATALVIAYAGPQSGNFLYKSNAFFFQLAIIF